VLVEGVPAARVRSIVEQYAPPIVSLRESVKEELLAPLVRSWTDNQDHGKIRHWGRAASGIARYLLEPTWTEEVLPDPAADLVVRVSRWYHSEGRFWVRFQPYAETIVRAAWGDIDDLYRTVSVKHR
jgi:hypothetical protein